MFDLKYVFSVIPVVLMSFGLRLSLVVPSESSSST